MNNTEAFEFLLSWKDDVLMNCLSGRRDKAFDPQAMQKVRAACARPVTACGSSSPSPRRNWAGPWAGRPWPSPR